ncbi:MULTISPECIES: hypothetical protein [unclassified Bartonella]
MVFAGQSFRCWRFVRVNWGYAGCRISGDVMGGRVIGAVVDEGGDCW